MGPSIHALGPSIVSVLLTPIWWTPPDGVSKTDAVKNLSALTYRLIYFLRSGNLVPLKIVVQRFVPVLKNNLFSILRKVS